MSDGRPPSRERDVVGPVLRLGLLLPTRALVLYATTVAEYDSLTVSDPTFLIKTNSAPAGAALRNTNTRQHKTSKRLLIPVV